MKAAFIGIALMLVILGGLYVVTEGSSGSTQAATPAQAAPSSALSDFKIN